MEIPCKKTDTRKLQRTDRSVQLEVLTLILMARLLKNNYLSDTVFSSDLHVNHTDNIDLYEIFFISNKSP